jgi:hypothetical protein
MQVTIEQLPPAIPAPAVTLQQAASEWAGREVSEDEVAGCVDSNVIAAKPYIVTVRTNTGKRYSVCVIAGCWFEAWSKAANEYGLASLVVVKPAKKAAA